MTLIVFGDVVTKLKSFSDKYGVCLLVVHHTCKLESEDSFDMISGTNGLLGAADGAFIMHKKKRTDNTAVMDIVGRDQPDQELTIAFNREQCIWKFQKAETELWKQPPNPLLEAINEFLTENKPEWEGTATELLERLSDMQLSANVLSRKLNVVNSQLLNDYGIFYDVEFCHPDIKEVYHTLFDEALERYNAKQKRSDRKIDDYYEKIRR